MLTINPFRAMPQQKQNHQKQHSPAFKAAYVKLPGVKRCYGPTKMVTPSQVRSRLLRAANRLVVRINDPNARVDGNDMYSDTYKMVDHVLALTGREARKVKEAIKSGPKAIRDAVEEAHVSVLSRYSLSQTPQIEVITDEFLATPKPAKAK